METRFLRKALSISKVSSDILVLVSIAYSADFQVSAVRDNYCPFHLVFAQSALFKLLPIRSA